MPKRFVKALSVAEKQEILLKGLDLKANDCVRIRTDIAEWGGSREDDYKIIKLDDGGYVLKRLGGDYVTPLSNLLTVLWVKVPMVTEFGNCKCEDVDCKECPLLYISFECGTRYSERFSNNCNSEAYPYCVEADIKAKRNQGLYKSTIRHVYDNFVDTTYPSKYKCLINWNAITMDLEKAADAFEENGVTYLRKRETEETKEEESE